LATSPEQDRQIAAAAEARNRRVFQQKTFAKDGFSPETSIGFFDGAYNPATRRLDITFNVKYAWQDGMGANKWDPVLQAEFMARAKQLIEDNWSNRYRLRCARPGWEDVYADVYINLREVTSGEHYILRVQKSSPGETLGGGINGSRGKFMALLSDLVLDETKSATNKAQIFRYKMDQLTEALAACGANMVSFDANSATLSDAAKGALGQFADKAVQVLTPDVVGMELYIFGSTGSVDKTMQMGLADRRAKSVRDYLANRVRHPDFLNVVSSTVKHGWLGAEVKAIAQRTAPAKSTTSFPGAALMMHVPHAFKHKQFVESHYIILLHEFGHMLGLPDEYMGIHDSGIANMANMQTLVPLTVSKLLKANPSDRVSAQQKGLGKYLAKAGVDSPVFIDTSSTNYSTTSVMSAGRDILPAHYLTIWACLASMTNDYIEPEEWRILPAGAPPVR
jgi:hypothetical protein